MDAGVDHVRPVPEDLLRAVALVGVDVDDRDPSDSAVADPLGRGGGVVEVARSAEERRSGVVPGRAHRRVGGRRAVDDEISRRDRAVHRRHCGVEGAGGDQRHRVHRVEPRLGPDRRRAAVAAAAGGERRGREQVGHDLGLAGVVQMALGDPGVVGAREEVDERRVVHGEHGIEAVVGGSGDRGPGGGELVAEGVAALRLLVARQPHAEPVAAVGRVPAVAWAPDDGHHQRHRGGRYALGRFRRCLRRLLVPARATSA